MDQRKRKNRQVRLRKTVKGTATRPRLSVYRSLTSVYLQLIDDENGKTVASASDMQTKKKESNIASAKNTGLQIAKVAKEKKITECVFDKGGYKYHGRVKAVAEGAREGGLKF